MTADDSLFSAARAWAEMDPDPETAAELKQIVDAAAAGDEAAAADLADRFDGTLEFGTAGLRGGLGAGPNRMNRVVVIRAAAGLAAYLNKHRPGGSVVIGYDARKNSYVFAHDTAEIMAGAGFTPHVMPDMLPTPILAYAIRELDARAGIMVTASHNPPEDNGYKVYLDGGSQIVPPADSDIAAEIAAIGDVRDLPRSERCHTVEQQLIDTYLDQTADLLPDGPRELTVAYTPLHGVGASSVVEVLTTAGFAAPHVVPSQEAPDGTFPTVAFPNPEEPGAMDACLALAEEVGADIAIANDPDADRCAVATPTDQGWQMLRGDEVGALLAHHLMDQGKTGTYATSIVSSSLLGRMATARGLESKETLTGFKWIGLIEGLAFGYEEALGYCVDPERVRDKDGVSAALVVCEIAAAAKAEGRTLHDLLNDIATEHGLHATDQLSVRVDDLSVIADAMERLRTDPPTELGGLAVERAEDLSAGSADLPPTDGLRYYLAENARVIVRPSGTEPKIKCYLEVVVPVDPDGGVDAARIASVGRLDAIRDGIKHAAGL